MTFGGGKNTVQVRIVGDASQFKRETKSAEKSSQTLVGTLKKHAGLIKTFLAVQAARAVKDFVFGSVRAFSDLNESINAVEVTFGDAAEGVLALGENAAESLGLANAEFNTLAVGFAAFVQQIAAEKDGDVVATMDELTTRVADFASVMNIDVTEAADKFRSGLAGETEPLRKFGLDVSAAAVNVRGLELGLGDVSGKLSEQEKVLARYNLIMEQTEKTAGDFANTSDDLANRTRILKASFTDVQAEIGEALVPAMEAALGLGENLIPVIGTLATAFAGLTGTLNISAEAFKNFAKERGREVETTRDMVVAISDEADARRNWADFLLFGIGPLEATTKALREHLQAAELSTDQLEEFRVEIAGLGDDNKLTAEQVDFLNGVLDDLHGVLGNKVLKATQDVRDAVLDGLDPALTGLIGTTDDLTGSEDEQAVALRSVVEAMAAKQAAAAELLNPLLRLITINDNLAAANQAVNEAEDEFGRASSEFRDAVLARAGVINDLKTTMQLLKSQGIDPTGEAARIMFAGLGVPQDVIDQVFGTFDRWEADFASRLLKMNVSAPVIRYPTTSTTNTFVPRSSNVIRLAHGGIATDPTLGVFGESGDEALIPLNDRGAKFMADVMEKALRTLGGETFSNPAHSNGGGSGTTVIVNGFVGSELALAAEIDRLLTRRSRSSPLGFQ